MFYNTVYRERLQDGNQKMMEVEEKKKKRVGLLGCGTLVDVLEAL